jgi:hypothetical protein
VIGSLGMRKVLEAVRDFGDRQYEPHCIQISGSHFMESHVLDSSYTFRHRAASLILPTFSILPNSSLNELLKDVTTRHLCALVLSRLEAKMN